MADEDTKFPETLEDWVEKLSDVVFPMFPGTIKSLKTLTDEDINRSVDRFCADILLASAALTTGPHRRTSQAPGNTGSHR